jgi:hypothetical protein
VDVKQDEGRRKWRGAVNGILYAVQFDQKLDDTVIEGIVTMIRNEKMIAGGPVFFAAAIEQALGQGVPLNDVIETPHSEASIRAFLEEIRIRLTSR